MSAAVIIPPKIETETARRGESPNSNIPRGIEARSSRKGVTDQRSVQKSAELLGQKDESIIWGLLCE